MKRGKYDIGNVRNTQGTGIRPNIKQNAKTWTAPNYPPWPRSTRRQYKKVELTDEEVYQAEFGGAFDFFPLEEKVH